MQTIISTLLQLKEWRFVEEEENHDDFVVARIFSWLSFMVTTTAASLGLWACRKPSYAKLHSAMALNIVGIFVYLILLCSLSFGQTQGLSKKLDSLGHEKEIGGHLQPKHVPRYYVDAEFFLDNITMPTLNETETTHPPNTTMTDHGDTRKL